MSMSIFEKQFHEEHKNLKFMKSLYCLLQTNFLIRCKKKGLSVLRSRSRKVSGMCMALNKMVQGGSACMEIAEDRIMVIEI